MKDKNPMILFTTAYSDLLDYLADITEILVEDLVLDPKSRKAVKSKYYTKEMIQTYWQNKSKENLSLSNSIDVDLEEKEYLDESILPDNFWNE